MSFLYESEDEIKRVVHDFETCATPKTEFKHREHLTVAVWYLQTLSRGEALDRMRSALLRFLDHHGVAREKYDETVTVFWMEKIAGELARCGIHASLLEKCNAVISSFNSPTRKPASRVAVGESPAKS